MRYKSEFPQSYEDGVVNMSVTLSRAAKDMLTANEIDNASAFLNDLVIEALQEKDYFKKRLMASINASREALRKQYGVETELKVTQ